MGYCQDINSVVFPYQPTGDITSATNEKEKPLLEDQTFSFFGKIETPINKLLSTGIPESATYGRRFQSLPNYTPIVTQVDTAYCKALTIDNNTIREQAISVLKRINGLLDNYIRLDFRIGELPELVGYTVADGSFTIEWIFEDFRIGFNIENDPTESGFHLVSKESLNSVHSYGSLINGNTDNIFVWLLNFALMNS
jgi:hypothetical protein